MSDTRVAASTRGTTSAWIGSMPSTRKASISSRMVRAPRSAHMAVAAAPAITRTVTTGPIWVTAPNAAPDPEKSAAPISTSRMFRVKVVSTVNGMASSTVGIIETRATNQHWSRNSRHAHGGRKIWMIVSRHRPKNSPSAIAGAGPRTALTQRRPVCADEPCFTSNMATSCDTWHFASASGHDRNQSRGPPYNSPHKEDTEMRKIYSTGQILAVHRFGFAPTP